MARKTLHATIIAGFPVIDLGPSTNKGVAVFKILHESEETPLLRDPYLKWFFSDDQLESIRMSPAIPETAPDGPDERFFWNSYWWTILREIYLDEVLEGALGRGCRQVLNLGAGFDTRFFRLLSERHPSVRMIEVDLPPTAEEKRRCIVANLGTMPDNLRIVSLDLNSDRLETLLGCGYTPELPSAYLMQGVSYYLPKSSFENVVSFVSENAAAGSVFAYDNCHEEMVYDNDLVPGIGGAIERLAAIGEPYLFAEPPSSGVARLERRGWSRIVHLEGQDLQVRYGRERSLSPLMWYVVNGERS